MGVAFNRNNARPYSVCCSHFTLVSLQQSRRVRASAYDLFKSQLILQAYQTFTFVVRCKKLSFFCFKVALI